MPYRSERQLFGYSDADSRAAEGGGVMVCPNCHGSGVVEKCEEKRRDEHVVMVTLTEVKCDKCNGTGEVPITKADRISSMNDEELATLLAEAQVVMAELMLKQFGIDFSFSAANIKKIARTALETIQQPWEEE